MSVAHGHAGFGYAGTLAARWLPRMSTQDAAGGATPPLICTWVVPSYFTTGDLYVRGWGCVVGARTGFSAAAPGSTLLELTADQTTTVDDSQSQNPGGVGPGNVGLWNLSDLGGWTAGRLFSLRITPTSGANNSWDFKLLFSDDAGFV